MKKLIWLIAAVIVTGATVWFFTRDGETSTRSYRFVTIEEGPLESVVSSTGTLDAVTTVQVGTQVSGIINKINVDFNDDVRKGEVIAQLDTALLSSAVEEASASIARSQAQLNQAKLEFERTERLYENQVVTEVEYNAAKYSYEIAVSNLTSAELNLKRAQQNLNYATIYAPISGKVIERNVDVGQTVAASLSAPQLFLIANDLSKMQILASVDESDIGLIKEGMDARFTVQAFDEETFMGTVRQVRLQSNVQENVVNYTVVIDVSNPEGKLLPGMTAIVDFLVETVDQALKLPNAALRFTPTEDMIAEMRERMQARMAARRDSLGGGEGNEGGAAAQGSRRTGFGGGNGSGRGFGGGSRDDITMLWYLDDEGGLNMVRARTGISDGQNTEVTGNGLTAGMQIIAGVTTGSSSSSTSTSSSPFQQQQSGGRRFGF